LRPFTTIVIAEEGLKAPFDVNHVVIRSYKHLGEDIGFDEVMRFRAILTGAIGTIAAQAVDKKVDSPVYRFVKGLLPPHATPADAAPAAPGAEAVMSAAVGSTSDTTHSALMKQVNDAIGRSDFVTAKTLLSAVHALLAAEVPARPMDPYIVQRLALVTYKSKHPTEPAALQEAAALLATLEPETSNDTETLGLWGAIHKRLWTLTEDRAHLDEAVRALGRGFYLRNDYYNGINFAFLLNVRATRTNDAAEAIADFVLARRVRSEVLAICDRWLKDNPKPVAEAVNQFQPGALPVESPIMSERALKQDAETRYWVTATMAEAMVGLGHAAAQQSLETTYASAPASWMADSTRDQVGRLLALIADSPMKHLKPGA
jgi:hypothetical protein